MLRANRICRTLLVATGCGLLPVVASAGALERFSVTRLLDESRTIASWRSAEAHDGLASLVGAEIPLGADHPDREALSLWLRAHRAAFGLVDSSDGLVVVSERPLTHGLRAYRIVQTSNDVPVEFATGIAEVDEHGELRSLLDEFRPVGSWQPAASLSLARLSASGASALGVRLSETKLATRAALLTFDGADRPAIRVSDLAHPERGAVWLDAETGEHVRDETVLTHAVGNVFLTDPRVPYEPLALNRLLGDGSRLRSQSYSVYDLTRPPLVVPDGDFRVDTSDVRFDPPNTYWHVDHFLHDVLGGLGYEGPPDSIVIRVREPLAPGVALTTGHTVLLGLPLPGYSRDASLGDDIVYHETQHAVTYGFGIQPTGTNQEPLAIHEGVSDFFAAVATNDPSIGEYVYMVYPAGVTRVDRPANVFNVANYNQVRYGGVEQGTGWANGMIVSGMLWDIHLALGATGDSIALEALPRLPTNPMLADLADALLLASADGHASVRIEQLLHLLTARGFRPTQSSIVASIMGPAAPRSDTVVTFRAANCCGLPSGTYEWSLMRYCRGVPCASGWEVVGSGTTLEQSFDADADLRLRVVTSYGDTLESRRFVSVDPPGVTILGPNRAVLGKTSSWRSARSGLATSVQWTMRKKRPGSTIQFLGFGESVSIPVDGDFTLTVLVTDPVGRTAGAQMDVAAYVEPAFPAVPATKRLVLDSALPRAKLGVVVRAGLDGPARIERFDTQGRRVETLWSGDLVAGDHSFAFDTSRWISGLNWIRFTDRTGSVAQRVIRIR